jgi:hypothetical protein
MRTLPLNLMTRVALAAALSLPAATVTANLVTNGSFENTTVSTTTPWMCPTTTPCIVNDWSLANTNPAGNNGQILVHSSWNGSSLFGSVGIAGSIGLASPDGGNFIFSDADFHNSPIDQAISGLTPGASYVLRFYQALVQDTEPGITLPGPVTAHWQVSFGTGVQNSAAMAANGATLTVSPWALQSMSFTASAATQVLSFVSVGTGDPPLLALDGVQLERVPEPGSVALVLMAGLAAAAVYRRTRWQHIER